MSYQQENFKRIADTIRSLSGWSNKIKPSAFADSISSIHEAALMHGHQNGLLTAHSDFWDAFQQNGERTNYYMGFAYWEDACYNPKYPIVTASTGTPANIMFDSAKITDTRVDIFVNCTAAGSMFRACRNLKTVKRLVLTENTTSFGNFATNCSELENFNVEGVINGNIDLHWSAKLTHESLMKILNCLADKTTDTSGTEWVCTLGTTNLNKLTDAEKAIATGKGWVLA